jgi:hypothetical protein
MGSKRKKKATNRRAGTRPPGAGRTPARPRSTGAREAVEPSLSPLGSAEECGEWLRRELSHQYGTVSHRLFPLTAGVVARLNESRAPGSPLALVALKNPQPSAFIGPGRWFYMTQGLLERIRDEDQIAFVAAHEMAHHDLGHTGVLHEYLRTLRDLPAGTVAAFLLTAAGRFLLSPEHEADADARALDLCLAAGFHAPRCIRTFDVLEAWALEKGDEEIVFGPPNARLVMDRELQRRLDSVRTWTWQRVRGYPSIRDRKAALLTRLEEHYAREELEECLGH